MATKKHPTKQVQRQRAAREARAAAVAARRRVIRQRVIIIGIAAAAIVAIVVKMTSGGSSKPSASATSTTVSGASGSAAGTPCVAEKGPLPAGAPSVPVRVGPPPASLVAEDVKVGTGAVVTANQTLTVNYIGVSCSTGKVFDSSYKTGSPASFPLSGVIPGWQKGIPGMKVGGRRLLGIPPAQGYGTAGSPPDIGPNETLWFIVEVLDAKAA